MAKCLDHMNLNLATLIPTWTPSWTSPGSLGFLTRDFATMVTTESGVCGIRP